VFAVGVTRAAQRDPDGSVVVALVVVVVVALVVGVTLVVVAVRVVVEHRAASALDRAPLVSVMRACSMTWASALLRRTSATAAGTWPALTSSWANWSGDMP
jgi:hypothetical protein